MRHAATALLFAVLSSACEPELLVGKWTCPPPGADQVPGNLDKVLDAPWTTGFETGFCDYIRAGGVCYTTPDASHRIVDEPVHGGHHAAAYSVTTDPAKRGTQSRCFREGALPVDAFYGAWFYVPTLATNTGNWNRVHFEGRTSGALHGLWDISLRSADDGRLFAYLFDSVRGIARVPTAAPEVPIGSWFHLEMRLRRASDASGVVALYQDGVLLIERTGISMVDTDFGQWYVGNLADGLTPTDSTIYVDDVTVRAAP